MATHYGGDYGQSLPGEPLAVFVSQWVLTALAPAALTLSLEATARLEPERQALDRRWPQRLERAAYERERAARHDRVIEAAQRLVARHRAQDWENKLMAQRHLQEADHRFGQTRAQPLSRAEREAIAPLAQNMPSLWQAPTTTMADRQERVRQLIQRVMVAGEGLSDRLHLTSEGGGGGTTAGIPTRPRSRLENLGADPLRCERLRPLVPAGYSTVERTAGLAHEGFPSPKPPRPFSRQSVVELMRRLGVHQPRRRRRPPWPEHEWWWSALARELSRSTSTLHQWRTRGGLKARWHEQSKRWVAGAAAAELARLQQWCARPAGDESRKMWLDALPAHPTASPSLTHVYSPQRRDVMPYDYDKQCLDDSIMVDTSTGHWGGSIATDG